MFSKLPIQPGRMLLRDLLTATAMVALSAGTAAATESRQIATIVPATPESVVAPAVPDAIAGTATALQRATAGLDAEAAAAVDLAYRHNVGGLLWQEDSIAGLRAALGGPFGYLAAFDAATAAAFDTVAETRLDSASNWRRDADIALSALFAQLAAELSPARRTAATLNMADDAALSPRTVDLTSALLVAARGDVALALSGLEPHHHHYRSLKAAWQRYDGLVAQGGWATLADGDLVHPGERDHRIPALRSRLAAEGFGTAPAGPAAPGTTPAAANAASTDTLDPALTVALEGFQRQNGLDPDGVIGPNTLAALNESVESKRARIATALAQWRAAGPLGERYVMINIPSFSAVGWNADKREITMRAIVGLPDRQTPSFSDTIEYVVTRPEWNVPVSIMQRDKLPKLRADPGYADAAGFRIYDRTTGARVDASSVDWYAPGAGRRYNMIQQPGPQNALGDLKIIFPNRHAVYMHGTPGRHLFARAQRAFSSGCVRIEQPERFAAWVAQPDDTLLNRELARDFGSAGAGQTTPPAESRTTSSNRWYKLAHTLPVHIVYITVGQAEDGELRFWRDIYERHDSFTRIDLTAALGLGVPNIATAELR